METGIIYYCPSNAKAFIHNTGWAIFTVLMIVLFSAIAALTVSRNRAIVEKIDKILKGTFTKNILFTRINHFKSWLRQTLSSNQYLLVHLSTGFVLSIVIMIILTEFFEGIRLANHIAALDIEVAYIIENLHTPGATIFFIWLSDLGTWGIFLTVLITGIYFIVYKRRFDLFIWITANVGADILDIIIKEIIRRPRPFLPHLEYDWGYSFPSGHAMVSFVCYGFLAYFAIIDTKIWERKVVIFFVTFALVGLIGFSRIYLEVHYLSDVLGGYAAGLIWLLSCISASEINIRFSRQKKMLSREL